MWSSALLTLATLLWSAGNNPADVVVVIGAAGTPEYGELFQTWAQHWEAAAIKGGARLTVIGRAAGDNTKNQVEDRELLRKQLMPSDSDTSELWIVLIGHGTFDRRDAKFNLRGPDVSANELKDWLARLDRPVAIIDTSAASAPFLQALAGDNRVAISATKSGAEQNFAQFGGYLSEAINDLAADLDKDQQVSLWEAFLFASRRVEEFYKSDGRLQTEHALLDDNGDGQGTRADAFRGLVAIQESADANAALDGDRAHQWHLVRNPLEANLPMEIRRQRDALELELLALKRRKSQLAETEYYDLLEDLLLRMVELQALKSP